MAAEVYLLSLHIMTSISQQKHTPNKILYAEVRKRYSYAFYYTSVVGNETIVIEILLQGRWEILT